MSSFQIKCFNSHQTASTWGRPTWRHIMAPNSTDKFRIFTHEKWCDSSGCYNWLCSCSKLKRIVHQHPLVSVEITHIYFHCLSFYLIPIHLLPTLLLPCPPSCLLTRFYLLYSRLWMHVGVSKFVSLCICYGISVGLSTWACTYLYVSGLKKSQPTVG